MVAKNETTVAWQCECGKRNARENERCWKCHKPKVAEKKRREMKKK